MSIAFLTKRPNPVIRSSEGLVFKTTAGEYEGKSGPFQSYNDIIAYADENTLVIFHDESGHFMDITEAVADVWLTKYPDTTPSDAVPAYVKASEAWEIYCGGYPAPKPLSARMASSYYSGSAGRR